jgi:hypothetical protein
LIQFAAFVLAHTSEQEQERFIGRLDRLSNPTYANDDVRRDFVLRLTLTHDPSIEMKFPFSIPLDGITAKKPISFWKRVRMLGRPRIQWGYLVEKVKCSILNNLWVFVASTSNVTGLGRYLRLRLEEDRRRGQPSIDPREVISTWSSENTRTRMDVADELLRQENMASGPRARIAEFITGREIIPESTVLGPNSVHSDNPHCDCSTKSPQQSVKTA